MFFSAYISICNVMFVSLRSCSFWNECGEENRSGWNW